MRHPAALALCAAALLSIAGAASAQDYYDPAQGFVSDYGGRVYTTSPSLTQPSRNAYSALGQSEGYADVAMPYRGPSPVRVARNYAQDPLGGNAYDEYGQATGLAGQADVAGASPIPREAVSFDPRYAPGTIVVESAEKRLYYVTGRGEAISYGVGVGRPGFNWSGVQTVSSKKEWPSWTPPAEMIRRRPDLPRHMAGGIDNPLGARALYLGSSLYRIHGSNEPETIGTAVSSGCIRMTNEDVTDLYERVQVGAKVIVN